MMNSFVPVRSGALMNENLNILIAFKEDWNQNLGIDQVKATVQDLVTYIKLESLLPLAEVVLKAGIMRQESRGVHQRIDFAEMNSDWRKNIIAKHEGDQEIFSVVPVDLDFVM